MNGKQWLAADTATLERMAGKHTDAEIAAATGHKAITVRVRRTLLGLSPWRPKRPLQFKYRSR